MIVSAILFGIAANSDNLSIGISYGVKRRHILWQHNIAIAVITTIITLIALAAGHLLREYLLPHSPSWLSGALVMLLALWSAYKQPHADMPTGVNRELTTLQESFYLSLALSINNIGLAVAGGIGNLTYGAVTLSIFGFSIIMLAAGQLVGLKLVERVGGFLSHPMFGNAVLFFAGVMMFAGL